jgi:hypothetical protein
VTYGRSSSVRAEARGLATGTRWSLPLDGSDRVALLPPVEPPIPP